MLARTISAPKTLAALVREYNSYAASAAWFKCCEHDQYKMHEIVAAAFLQVVELLFKIDKDYRLVTTAEMINGTKFEWQKMEVVE